MRIIAGRWRGRSLESPEGRATRPTSDRVREALFSMLTSRLGSFEDLRVADLFAGSGALGFEAMSRGASEATFVENDREAAAAIRRNAQKLGAKVQLFTSSALTLPRAPAFDVVFADPPYGAGSGTNILRSVLTADWLSPGGWMTIETSRGEPVEGAGCEIDAVREIGRARLTLLRRP